MSLSRVEIEHSNQKQNKAMDIFGIKRRAEKKREEMRKVYLERKKHYENVWYDIDEVLSTDIGDMLFSIYTHVIDLREKIYDRNFESLDELTEHILGRTQFKEILNNANKITIDVIEMLSPSYSSIIRKNIGCYRYSEVEDNFFYQITDKDVLYVLEKLGFKRYF